MASQIKVNEIIKQSGSSIGIGETGDTISLTGNTINLGTTGNTVNIAGSAYAAAADNTPAFAAVNNATQTFSMNSWTKANIQTEVYDTNNAFSDSRFTVPSGEAGKYLITIQAGLQSSDVYREVRMGVYKNGAIVESIEFRLRLTASYFNGGSSQRLNSSGVLSLAVGDYIELYALMDGSGTPQFNSPTVAMTAMKIIGA